MDESDIRMAALCKRLGSLWTKKTVKALDGKISVQKIQECKLSLIGQLYLNPKVNIQAFQSTMKRVWKLENMEIALIADGVFEFQFRSENDRNRILNQGPWSFANHLLLLKPWEPNTPPTSYSFTTCEFWVHIHGLPTEWISENLIRSVAEEAGLVIEVKIETRGYTSQKVGKAKVQMDISAPLISGSFYSNNGKKLWLDFHYERLPYYCYSCGKLGHYAHHCKEFPHTDETLPPVRTLPFGSWLKVEANEDSPYKEIFYGKKLEELLDELEYVPDTPASSGQLVVYGTTQEEAAYTPNNGKGKNPMSAEQSWEDADSPTWNDQHMETRSGGKLMIPKMKNQSSKKLKRYSPYEKHHTAGGLLDETQLLDTPIQQLEEAQTWALVASPNKPPGYK